MNKRDAQKVVTLYKDFVSITDSLNRKSIIWFTKLKLSKRVSISLLIYLLYFYIVLYDQMGSLIKNLPKLNVPPAKVKQRGK